MAHEYKAYIPLNLKKLDRLSIIKRLTIGEPYHFLMDKQIVAEHPKDENTIVTLGRGDIFSKIYATNFPAMAFEIYNVTHNEKDQTWFYETTFIGYRIFKEQSNGMYLDYIATDVEGNNPLPPPMTSNL